MTTISLIVPVYNAERFLTQCLNSALSQTLQSIEIICVDDCSVDNSFGILNAFSERDHRVVVLKNRKNSGLSFSRNRGLKHATGEYVFFLDADDYIENRTLEILYDIITREKLDVLGFNYDQVFEDAHYKKGRRGHTVGNIFVIEEVTTGKDLFCKFANKNVVAMMSWMYLYSRDFLLKEKLSFKEGILHEDNLFYFETMMKASRVRTISNILYHYRRHASSITLSSDNLTNAIDSLCYILYLIGIRLECESDRNVQQAISYYMISISRSILNKYQNIDALPKGFEFKYKESRAILGMCKSGLYRGFYLNKLSPDEMKIIRESKLVIIYGAGETGMGLQELLMERGISVDYFAVSDIRMVEKERRAYTIDQLAEKSDEAVVLIASIMNSDEMKCNALKLGFKNVIVPQYF
ncbi:MAG: glycosyltransferase [Lachnospiraceae bacterium]|nr:glycosyltransferase [Lachnospiraceae bacterium]